LFDAALRLDRMRPEPDRPRRLQATPTPRRRMPMAHYADGFVVPVPRAKLDAYQRMAEEAGRVWMEHGALQ
jgi:uncharacterized protein DUF1428